MASRLPRFPRPHGRGRERWWITAGLLLLIMAIGVLYRSTFLAQGFSLTDEGWVQSVGTRIVAGQLMYRDFFWITAPLTPYKEAAFIAILGDAYTVLMSRWFFSVEVALMSGLAFLIMRRFLPARAAFLLSLPAVFFSVLYFYFSNYTYDGSFFALCTVALLVYSKGRWPLALAAGVTGALAALAKQPYVSFLVLIPAVAIIGWAVDRRRPHPLAAGIRRNWPLYMLGFVITLAAVLVAYKAAGGSIRDFVQRGYFEVEGDYTVPLTYILWQDLFTGTYMWPVLQAGLPLLVLILVSRLIPFLLVGLAALVWFAVGLVVAANGGLPFENFALPNLELLVMAAAVTAIVQARRAVDPAQRIFPVEVPLLALGLQYLGQYGHTGVVAAHITSFLSIPVALWWLYRISGPAPGRLGSVLRTGRAGVPAAVGVWLIAGANFSVHQNVYGWTRIADSSRLSATMSAARLNGIHAVGAIAVRTNGILAAVERYSLRGDPVLVMQDFPALYWVADRANATPQDWYFDRQVSKATIAASLDAIRRHPPRVVIIEKYTDFDPHQHIVFPYEVQKDAPLWDYIVARYTLVETAVDFSVYVPPKTSLIKSSQ